MHTFVNSTDYINPIGAVDFIVEYLCPTRTLPPNVVVRYACMSSDRCLNWISGREKKTPQAGWYLHVMNHVSKT